MKCNQQLVSKKKMQPAENQQNIAEDFRQI